MLRIGVIGTGAIAAVHLDGWRQMPGIELVGYYDILPEAADRAAQRYGGRVFRSLGDLFAAVDMVDICSPGTAHKENVLAAAAARKAIICEKPLARHLHDAVEMVETCERAGVPLFPAQVVRFFPMYTRVKERIDAGAIGKPAVFRSARCGSFPRPGRDFSAPYYADFHQSGGVILDVAVHDIDFARWCCGEVERIFVRRRRWAGPPSGEHAFALLRFAGGAIGHIEGGWNRPRGIWTTKIEIAGDGGLVEVDNSAPPLALHLHSGNRPPLPVTEDDPYLIELGHFMDCLEGRAQPIVTARDALAALEISLAGMESARTGRAVTLSHGEV